MFKYQRKLKQNFTALSILQFGINKTNVGFKKANYLRKITQIIQVTILCANGY